MTIKQTKCHCGRKKDYQGQSCTIVNGCSRCPCIRSENPCNSECKCKNCNNPCGIRQVVSTRSRKSYLVQKQQPLCGRPGQDFMTHFGEKISYGTLSQLETLVLKCATVFFILHGIDLLPKHLYDTYELIFNVFVHYCTGICFPLFTRKLQGMVEFLKKILVKIELFKKLYLN